MKTKIYSFAILPLFFLMAPNRCTEAEYVNNSRIFVEGNIKNLPSKNINIDLACESILISTTQPDSQGNFKLGGPGTTEIAELRFPEKIDNFSASITGCKLSYDSTCIYFPERTTYVKFNQITFKP